MDKPWKVIWAFIGVFVAGSLFGGLLALRFDLTRHWMAAKHAVGPADAPVNPSLMQRFAKRLKLTPEQKEQLRPVMERAGEDFRRIALLDRLDLAALGGAPSAPRPGERLQGRGGSGRPRTARASGHGLGPGRR